jgi:hypothetical protein
MTPVDTLRYSFVKTHLFGIRHGECFPGISLVDADKSECMQLGTAQGWLRTALQGYPVVIRREDALKLRIWCMTTDDAYGDLPIAVALDTLAYLKYVSELPPERATGVEQTRRNDHVRALREMPFLVVTERLKSRTKLNPVGTSYCNHPHDLSTGRPIGHECYVLPPKALVAERAGNVELSIELIHQAKPLKHHMGAR